MEILAQNQVIQMKRYKNEQLQRHITQRFFD